MSEPLANRDMTNFERGLEPSKSFLTIKAGCTVRTSDGRNLGPGMEVDPKDPCIEEFRHKLRWATREIMPERKESKKATKKKAD